jgi:nickel transport protein
LRYPEARHLLRHAVLAIAILAAMAAPASAHRLKVFASAIGDSIEGEAYFVGSGPAAGVAVTLRDGADKVLSSGTTGPDGRFALPVSGAGDIVVTVDAQDGHVARFTVAGSTPASRFSAKIASALALPLMATRPCRTGGS